MKKIGLLISALMILSPALACAWDGYDYDADNYIEIKDNDTVTPGNDVEIYDYSDESCHTVYVVSVNRNGAVTIDVFDYDTGDYRTFEMDIFPEEQNKEGSDL